MRGWSRAGGGLETSTMSCCHPPLTFVYVVPLTEKKSLSGPIRNTTDNNSFSLSPATDTHTQLTSPGNSTHTNNSRESKPFTFPASTAHLVASAPAICARPKLRVGRCQNSPRRCRPRFLHDLGGRLSDLGRCLRMSMSGSRGWLCQSCWVLVTVCQRSWASGS